MSNYTYQSLRTLLGKFEEAEMSELGTGSLY